LSALAHMQSLSLQTERLGVGALGNQPPDLLSPHARPVRREEVGLIGKADPDERASRTFWAVDQRRRNRPRSGQLPRASQVLVRALNQLVGQLDAHAFLRLDEVDLPVVASESVLPEDERLETDLDALGFIGAFGNVG